MHRAILSLILVLIATPAFGASEPVPAPRIATAEAPASPAAPRPAMRLEQIAVEERATDEAAAAVQLGPRGGFWWMVGVIVVAALILTVLL